MKKKWFWIAVVLMIVFGFSIEYWFQRNKNSNTGQTESQTKLKENTKETRKLVSTAVAELIIMIQTGIEKVNYIMIILTLLVVISSLLYIVKKVNVKES